MGATRGKGSPCFATWAAVLWLKVAKLMKPHGVELSMAMSSSKESTDFRSDQRHLPKIAKRKTPAAYLSNKFMEVSFRHVSRWHTSFTVRGLACLRPGRLIAALSSNPRVKESMIGCPRALVGKPRMWIPKLTASVKDLKALYVAPSWCDSQMYSAMSLGVNGRGLFW